MKLDSAFLADVGLGELSDEDQASLLAVLAESLELRVGTALAGLLTEDQLSEFELLMDQGDGTAAETWLTNAIPDYKQAVRAALEDLKAELRLKSDEILASASRPGID